MFSKTFIKKPIYDKIGSFHIYLLICIVLLVKTSYCSYPITIKDRSLKLPPYLCSSSTAVYQDVIYAYGGSRFEHFNETAALYSYTLDQTTGEMVVRLVSLNEGPICSTCSVVLYPDDAEIWVFAEPIYKSSSKFYTKNKPQETHPIIIPHIYHIKNNTWSVLSVDIINGNRSTFYGRVFQTTVLGKDGTVYVLGGAYRDGTSLSVTSTGATTIEEISVITDGWYYNKTENSYNVMALPTQDPYLFSVGFLDLDGNVGFLFGANSTQDDDYVSYYSGSKLNTYNTVTKSWSVKDLAGSSAGDNFYYAGATVQVDYDRKLLYSLGGYFVTAEQSYISRRLLILDLVNNIWLVSGVQADSQTPPSIYDASSALIMNNTYLVRLFGIQSDQSWSVELNTVDILRLSFKTPFDNATLENKVVPIKWLDTILPPSNNNRMTITMIIISVLFPIGFFIIAIAFLYIYGRVYLPILWNDFKYNTLWSQRKGEPIWVEASRLIMRIVSFFLIVAFLTYNINNVITSPVSESILSEPVDFITIPDVRICFSGWNSSVVPTPNCYYDIDVEDSDCELIPLNEFNYMPIYSNELAEPYHMSCYLYAPSKPVNVTENRKTFQIISSGNMYEQNEAIFIQLYRPSEDINRVIYLDQDLPDIGPLDVLDWSLTDVKSDLQVAIFPNSYTHIEYQEINYQKIKPDKKWNYFGIFPVYSEFVNLTMDYTQPVIPNQFESDGEAQYMYNSITIAPQTFTKITKTEQRDSTIIDVIGSIGGVLGLIVGLQIYLFGNRPTNPWGLIQRRTGKYKKLSDELEKNFYLNEAQIPFVTPVHQRFMNVSTDSLVEKQRSDPLSSQDEIWYVENNESLEMRVSHLEARNQLLEMVLKSYYIDDEVFLALDYARRNSDRYLQTVVMDPDIK